MTISGRNGVCHSLNSSRPGALPDLVLLPWGINWAD